MKSPLEITRTIVPRLDGQRRWDVAYQLLLQWSSERNPGDVSHKLKPAHQKENAYESSTLCSCLNHPPTTGSDD